MEGEMDIKNALQADRSLIELCGDWRINRRGIAYDLK